MTRTEMGTSAITTADTCESPPANHIKVENQTNKQNEKQINEGADCEDQGPP
jgi:hypothetical protein